MTIVTSLLLYSLVVIADRPRLLRRLTRAGQAGPLPQIVLLSLVASAAGWRLYALCPDNPRR